MMRTVVEVNGGTKGSTGKIMFGIAETARENSYEVYTFSPPGKSQRKDVVNHMFIGNVVERRISEKINLFTGRTESLNLLGTGKFLKMLERIHPDIIHLHVMHGNYINIKKLFKYIKRNNIVLVWTLHDCWSFTGQCPYFDITGCQKWLTECGSCSYKGYPAPNRDHSRKLFQKKKSLFSDIENMVIITPSRWLEGLVKQSFLKKYPVKVIFNGIDLEIFKPRKSDFRERHGIRNKFVILGVAFSWGYRKGQDRFERLAESLDDRFQIVLVGIDYTVCDKIICISRTENQEQLAELYSAADVFLNPTREDNFPTVNIEALACGTPVLSYGAGGSAEAFDEKSGMIVSDDTIIDVLNKLYYKNFRAEDCLSCGREFEQKHKFKEYVELYDLLLQQEQGKEYTERGEV